MRPMAVGFVGHRIGAAVELDPFGDLPRLRLDALVRSADDVEQRNGTGWHAAGTVLEIRKRFDASVGRDGGEQIRSLAAKSVAHAPTVREASCVDTLRVDA